MAEPTTPWQPNYFVRFLRALDTSMGTAEIITDAGSAYIKALGNRQGPHPLACEWVATQLARWFGLPTFEVAILRIDAATDEIPFLRGGKAQSGPAFVARKMEGRSWGGTDADLRLLVNPETISQLILFDTWTLNCDRHPPDLATRRPNPDNVFMSTEGVSEGHLRLIAMDHTHCFSCGRDLTPRMGDIDKVQDERFHGLFPEFEPYLRRSVLEEARSRLRQVERAMVRTILNDLPREWEVSDAVIPVWEDLICQRAAYVAGVIVDRLLQRCREP